MNPTQEKIVAPEELVDIFKRFNETTARLEDSHRNLQRRVLELQNELAEKNIELERKKRLAALGEMAAAVAHEIRNPLGGIGLCAGLLRREVKNTRNAELVKKIVSGVSNMNDVIEGMLAFTRNIVPKEVECDLEAILRQSISMLEREIGEAQAEIALSVPERGVTLIVDPMLLDRAFTNIVQNAVQVVGSGCRVDIRVVMRSGGEVEISFRDNGPGISDEIIEKIFNPFFTARDQGIGLGLAIVHRIVEAHGGRIIAENAAGGGAAFTVSLPVTSVVNGKKKERNAALAENRT